MTPNAPTWGELEKFLQADGWTRLPASSRGGSSENHIFFEKLLDTGELLQTHISHSRRGGPSPGRFGVILSQQIKVSRAQFWEALSSGEPVPRPAPLDTEQRVATSVLTTADELLHMPDDGMRHELVRGELRTMTPAGARHGRLAVKVGGMLFEHERKTASGVAFGAETGFLVSRDPDTVRAPDAAFVSKERFEAVGDTEKFWPGAPDFAAEVISPKDTFHEVQDKALEWLAAGTIAVLVLDPPKRTATVYRGGGDAHVYGDQDTLDLSDAVGGRAFNFTVPVADLFA